MAHVDEVLNRKKYSFGRLPGGWSGLEGPDSAGHQESVPLLPITHVRVLATSNRKPPLSKLARDILPFWRCEHRIRAAQNRFPAPHVTSESTMSVLHKRCHLEYAAYWTHRVAASRRNTYDSMTLL